MSQRHIRALLDKGSTRGQAVRYFGVALVGLMVDFSLVYVVADVVGLHYLLAAVIGFLAGLTVTFSLSNAFVFGTPKTGRYKLFAVFGLIGLVGLGLLSLLMWLLTDFVGLHYLLSKVVATGFVFAWNFLARKALYRDQAPAPVEAGSA